METPVKKKRGRPRTSDQVASAISPAAPAFTETCSNSALAPDGRILPRVSPADLSSHPYQYATDIDMSNGVVTSNDDLEHLFLAIERGPDPDCVFHESHHEKMIDQLLEYNTRGPSPSRCNDEDWNRMIETSTINPTAEAQPLVHQTPQPPESSPPGLTTGTTNTVDNHTTDLTAAAATAPVTPRHTSRAVDALEASCTPPSLKIPKTSQLSKSYYAGLTLEDQSSNPKFSDNHSNGSSANGYSEPQSFRQETPARQPLGSPFAPATAPARRATAALMDVLDAPPPTGKRQYPMNNMSMSSPMPQTQDFFRGGAMQNMVDPRYQAAPVTFKTAPTPAMFMNRPQNNILLQTDSSMIQQPATKRMCVGSMGSQDLSGSMLMEQQMHRQYQLNMQAQQRPGTIDPRLVSNDLNYSVHNWISSQINNTPSPPELTPRSDGYDFPIPAPSGTLGGVRRKHENDFNVGQKRTASQMSRGDMDGSNTEDPFVSPSHGMVQSGGAQAGLFLPQNPTQVAMLMQSQQNTLRQLQMQSAMLVQARNQMQPINHFGSPTGAQTPGQLQLQAQRQLAMAMQAQGQGQFSQVSPSAQMRNVQQQRQSQQGTPQNPINTPRQMVRMSPSGASTGPQASPTPAPRRRATISKPAQTAVASSPSTCTASVKKVPHTPSKKRTHGQNTPASVPQNRTPSGNGQVSNAQMMETPEYMREQFETFQQTPIGIPMNQTPLAMHAHLPTPQQPISTGSCPNTRNETLAETNARTAAGLHHLGAEAKGYEPNFTPAVTDEDRYGFDQLGDMTLTGFGAPLGNMNFNSPISTALPSSTDFNTTRMNSNMNANTNVYANGSIYANANANANMNANGNMNMHPPTTTTMFPNMCQAASSLLEHTTNNPTTANLQTSMLNNGVRNSSVGYAETVNSGTATPVLHNIAHPQPNSNISAPVNHAADSSVLDTIFGDLTTPAAAARTVPVATDGPADEYALPFLEKDEIDQWVAEFDENAGFNPDDFGV